MGRCPARVGRQLLRIASPSRGVQPPRSQGALVHEHRLREEADRATVFGHATEGAALSLKRSKVHPSHKTRYKVKNWPTYDRALRRRGDLTIWFCPEVLATWKPLGNGRRGGQRRYSDVVIETALTLKRLFGLPWRQTEGLLASILELMGVALDVPDHTTLSRRTRDLDLCLRTVPRDESLHVIVDATGLQVFGQGEWAAAKWAGAREDGRSSTLPLTPVVESLPQSLRAMRSGMHRFFLCCWMMCPGRQGR